MRRHPLQSPLQSWTSWAPLVAVGACGILLLFFLSEPAARWVSQFLVGEGGELSEVARIVSLEGNLKTIRDGKEAAFTAPLNSPLTLANGDRLELSTNSHAVLILKSQDELKLSDQASLTLQLWDERNVQSPIYVTIQQGQVDLVRAGVRGRAYLVKEGRLYLPGHLAKPARSVLVLNRSEVDLNMAENQLQDESEQEPAAEDSEVPASGPTPETLSNEYIDEMIGRKQLQLQKCWLNRVRDNPTQNGHLVLQIEISRRGRVKEARVTDSDLNDGTLNNCVTAVVERINFRSFKGAEISLSYPIQFE